MTIVDITQREGVSMPQFTLGDWVRKARRDAGLEQQELADACRVSRALISKWERGHSVPSVEDFRRIISATGATWLVDYLLGRDEAAA